MNIELTQLLKMLFLPPGGFVLLLLLALLLWRNNERLAHKIVTVCALALWLMSLPAVSMLLMMPLEPAHALDHVDLLHTKAKAIVILGGGRHKRALEYDGQDTVNVHTLERVRYGAKLRRETDLPILVSGGAPNGEAFPEARLMERVLVEDYGISPRWVESKSRDTAENASYSVKLLREAKIDHILLVSTAWHLARAVPIFEKQGIKVTPAPTSFEGYRGGPMVWQDFFPQMNALQKSGYAAHELIGQIWYRVRY